MKNFYFRHLCLLVLLGLYTIRDVSAQTVFTYTGTVQSYVVPAGVTSLQIEALGAQGGTSVGGLGAHIYGEFTVTPGTVLNVVVGQQGVVNNCGGANASGGGGGGSFVWNPLSPGLPLVAAGGGGGGNLNWSGVCTNGGPGLSTPDGGAGYGGIALGGVAGSGGMGNGPSGTGSGGGGWLSAGQNSTYGNGCTGGVTLPTFAGGSGSISFGPGGEGGFGGGGGAVCGCGGGGGFSGGGSGQGSSCRAGGGGGGSYNGGTAQINISGVRSGNGEVRITPVVSSFTWTGAISSNWNTAGNWNPASVPPAGSNVLIPNVSPNFFPLIGTAVTVNDLTINAGATVDIAPGAGLVLDGTLDATAGVFTLRSDATGTAYLDDFTLGGTVLGPISVQRFNPLGVAGFRQLGTPVAMPNISGVSGFTPSGTPGFIIPDPACNPSYVASNSPYGNWMQLVENGTVQFSCSQSLFQVLTGGGMTAGRGYYMDVAGNSTLTFTGAPNTGSVNFGLTHANTAVTNGWNMVSNPYPSPLAWETGNVPAGVDGIGKIWVTSGTYTGTFQDLDPNVAGTAVAIGQAFQVRVSTPGGTPSFSVDNGDRTVTPPTYLFAGNESMTLNIDILSGGFADLAKVRFIQGATNAYDAMYDSPKMLGNSNQPMVYTVWNGENMSTNSFAELLDVYTVALGVKAAAAGQHSLVFSNTDQFPASAFIYLEDTENGTWQDVRTNDTYTYTAAAGVNESRFKIHFYPPVRSTTADAGCETTGSVVLEEQAPASWDYVITDAQNQTVSSGQLEGTATVNGLAAGDYTLTLSEQASGYVAVETFTVNGPAQVTATALASVTVAEAGEEIQFTAQTQNANTYSWDFGDGNSSQDMNPVHLYNAAGTYAVTLTASGDVCQAVSSLGISVTGGTAGTEDAFAQQGVNMWNAGGTVFISFGETWAGKTVFTLYDAQGRRVMNTQFADAQGTLTVDCGMLAAGVYTAELAGNGRIVTRKTVMGIK